MPKKSGFFNIKALGPGLLWAGAAIGVSHLVQSTRAGAGYGFALLWIVLLANFFKYPFFEFGPRYAVATGETLISGYRKMGRWVLLLYIILTVATMFTIQAAVTVVTASILFWISGNLLTPLFWSVVILIIAVIILLIGRYSLLDRMMKYIIVILTLTTMVAFAAALFKGDPHQLKSGVISEIWSRKGILFMVALMGWMPSAVDISVWSSIWSVEKRKATGYKPTLKETLFDFNLGYIGTSLISLIFLSLGALVVFGSGETLSSKGGVFAGQFIGIYTNSIGNWSLYIVAAAALTTMFSTTLTCVDAFSRVMDRSLKELGINQSTSDRGSYKMWLFIVSVGALLLLSVLKNSMGFMVDLATTLSFLTAPVLAVINYKAVTSKEIKKEYLPPRWLKLLSLLGILFLIAFSLLFLTIRFF